MFFSLGQLKSHLPSFMLVKWKCSMSFAIYELLHSGPSNSFFLHLGISLKSSKETSLGNLERYMKPYDGTIEVGPFFGNFQSYSNWSGPYHKNRGWFFFEVTRLEKHIPSLAFFWIRCWSQTHLFQEFSLRASTCFHKRFMSTSSAITHTQ